MMALEELRSLPVADRLRLIEDLWNSIADDPNSMPDSPEVIAELRSRKARFLEQPNSGIPWQQAKERIQSRCA
jgi:putative addiction module component (TIGR02574 family)